MTAARTQAPLTYHDIRDLPLALPLQGLLFEDAQGNWYGLLRFTGVKRPQALQQWAAQQDALTYLDMKQATADLVFAFRDEALQRLAWGALLMWILLALSLRNLRRTLVISLVLLLGVGLVVVMLNLLHIPLSLFHVISLLLVTGLGLDYSLFFTRPAHSVQSRLHTLQGLVICFCSTFVVFAILSSSKLPVLQSIGMTVMLGVACSFVLAWLLSMSAGSGHDK